MSDHEDEPQLFRDLRRMVEDILSLQDKFIEMNGNIKKNWEMNYSTNEALHQRIKAMENQIISLNEGLGGMDRNINRMAERLGKLETHHVRQIDENRSVSRALDELRDSDHDERIHDLENIQAEKRLCNLEEAIIAYELQMKATWNKVPKMTIPPKSYEEPLADALSYIIGHPDNVPKETINFINCLTTFLMRNEKATTGEILENLRGTPFEAVACKLAIREINLSP